MRRLAVLVPVVVAVSLMLPAAASAALSVEVTDKQCVTTSYGPMISAQFAVGGFVPGEEVEVTYTSPDHATTFTAEVFPDGKIYVGAGGWLLPFTATFTATDGESTSITLTGCASPLPTEKGECKDVGFKEFTGFANQGECVSFVATEGKNEPGKNQPAP